MVNDGHATGSRMVVGALALAMLALFVVNIAFAQFGTSFARNGNKPASFVVSIITGL